MSTYVYRYFEVKVKNFTNKYNKLSDIPEVEIKEGNYFEVWGEKQSRYWYIKDNHFTPCEYDDVPRKWVMAKWWKPCKYSFDKENSFKINGIDSVENEYFVDNGGAIRDLYLSQYWGQEFGLSDKGWPSDMSEELKATLKKHTYDEENERDYTFNHTYATLKELEDIYDKELEKFKANFTKLVTDRCSNETNLRLEYLSNLVRFCTGCNRDVDLEKKWEKTDEDSDEEYDEMKYLFEEDFNNLMCLHREMNRVWFITDEIFGWESEENIRVIYYMA